MYKNSPRLLFTVLTLLAAMLLAACGAAAEDAPPEAEAETAMETEAGAETAEEPESSSGAGLCANAYFPVVEGATWTFSGTGGPMGEFSFTETISAVRADGFTLTGSFDGLTRTSQWQCSEEGLTALTYGSGAESVISFAEGGGFTLETLSVTGVTLPASLAVGDSWTQVYEVSGTMENPSAPATTVDGTVSMAFEVTGEGDVSTPAGDFHALIVSNPIEFAMTANVDGYSVPVTFTFSNTVFYVQNVGWVHVDGTNDLLGETMTSLITLLSYSIP